jgi:hypothetical protein
LRKGAAAMQAEPFAGVTVPLDVEPVAADPVETCEGSVELFAEARREAEW